MSVPRAAGVVRFPLRFASGVMRARFNPADGQLYLCGLKGWQTASARDGTLCRVRYTGAPVHMPAGLRVLPNGLELRVCPESRPSIRESRFEAPQTRCRGLSG